MRRQSRPPRDQTLRMRLLSHPRSEPPSEPPSKADVEAVPTGNESALVALPDVIDLHGDVGIRVVRRAEDEGVPVELLERQEPLGHAELCVEVLVSKERHQVPRRPLRPYAVRRLAVEAAHRTRDVRGNAYRPFNRFIQPCGVRDEDLRKLSAQLQPVAL